MNPDKALKIFRQVFGEDDIETIAQNIRKTLLNGKIVDPKTIGVFTNYILPQKPSGDADEDSVLEVRFRDATEEDKEAVARSWDEE